MLSPGSWHERIPRDVRANLRVRRAVLLRAKDDVPLQRAIRYACSQDLLFYVNLFVWQYNPNHDTDEFGPFVTWPFQDRAFRAILDAIDGRYDLPVEKSREMGASWMGLLAFEWLWHFHPYKKFLMISRSQDLVDSHSPDSLFWKIDHVHKHLPRWLMPRGWEPKKHRLSMTYLNPENHSVIAGEATTGKAGVGGRATAMFVDEFAQIEKDYDVLHRTADTTRCRVFNSTHTGEGTAFAEVCRRVDLKKLVMHWSEHPAKNKGLYRFDPQTQRVDVLDKTYRYPPDFRFVTDGTPTGGPYPGLRSPWYDAECVRRADARAVAIDLDIDVKGSAVQVFDPVQLRAVEAEACRDPLWRGELRYDRSRARPLQLVPVASGPLKLWVLPDAYGKVRPGRYAGGADIALGTGATPSCLSVGDADTGDKVAEYTDARVSPEEFAALAVALCWLFSDRDGQGMFFGWEMAGPGLKFGMDVVEEHRYTRVYYREEEFKDVQKTRSDRPGWYPQPAAKTKLIADYRAALYARRFLNPSREAVRECLSFQYDGRGNVFHPGEKGNNPAAAGINHGDHVIADALCWKMMGHLGPAPAAPPASAEAADPRSVGGRRAYRAWRDRLADQWA